MKYCHIIALNQNRHIAAKKAAVGFTLMELLVAVTLLSIVMTSVYSLTNATLGAWRTVETGYDLHVEARSFIRLFTHEYNNIAVRAAHLFEGDSSDIVMFVIAQPLDLEQGEGPRLIRVEYSYNRNKRSIEREEALVKAALPPPQTEGESISSDRIKLDRSYKVTVANNVTRFNLRYVWVPIAEVLDPFEPPVPEPPIFFDKNPSEYGYPQAVEISLEFTAPEEPERKYEMVIMLPMRAPSGRLHRDQLEAMLDEIV